MAFTSVVLRPLSAAAASADGVTSVETRIDGLTMGQFFFNYTANTGTPTSITFRAEQSEDDGGPWHTLPFDMSSTGGAVAINQLTVVAATATGKYWGRVNYLVGNLVRAGWAIVGGTAPTFTFSVVFHGK